MLVDFKSGLCGLWRSTRIFFSFYQINIILLYYTTGLIDLLAKYVIQCFLRSISMVGISRFNPSTDLITRFGFEILKIRATFVSLKALKKKNLISVIDKI